MEKNKNKKIKKLDPELNSKSYEKLHRQCVLIVKCGCRQFPLQFGTHLWSLFIAIESPRDTSYVSGSACFLLELLIIIRPRQHLPRISRSLCGAFITMQLFTVGAPQLVPCKPFLSRDVLLLPSVSLLCIVTIPNNYIYHDYWILPHYMQEVHSYLGHIANLQPLPIARY